MGTYRATWVLWPLGIVSAVLLLFVVLSPWSGVNADEMARYRPLYLLTEIGAVSGIVVGSIRARHTEPKAWTALIVVVIATTLNTGLSMYLPARFDYGIAGAGLVLATVLFALMGVLGCAVPALLLRARLGERRDREGMIDAMAIAGAVGVVLWDALILSAAGDDLTSATILGALAVGVAVSATFGLLIRLAFTGIVRERAAQLMLAAGVGATAASVLLSAAGGSIVVGEVWPSELVKLMSLGLAAGATLHPSAARLGQRVNAAELGSGIGQGRLAVLAGALLVPAVATVIRSWWFADLRTPMAGAPPLSALLPSSLAALVVSVAVIWRMWQLLRDREHARERLRHHATHDDLTGLPNRRALYELLRDRVARGGGTADAAARFALLFLDLDGFKAINDTLGHEAGDMVLVEVAARIRSALRDGDVLTRPSGDEFVAVCDGPVDRALARQIAGRIHEQIVAPITALGVEVAIGASIGVALPPALTGDQARDAERMMRLADHAMYDAKRAGGRRTVLAHAHAGGHPDGPASATQP